MKEINSKKLALSIPSLEEMGRTITTAEDYEFAYQSLLRQVMGTIGISRGALLGFNQETRELHIHTLKGIRNKIDPHFSIILSKKMSELLQLTVTNR